MNQGHVWINNLTNRLLLEFDYNLGWI